MISTLIRQAKAVVLQWRRGGWTPPEPPGDPYAQVRVPLRRTPGGRSAAVAVAEPDEASESSATLWPRRS